MEGGRGAPPRTEGQDEGVLDGRYRLLRLIKRGAGIDTYLATDLHHDRDVIVKTAVAEAVSAPMRLRLEHEADVLARVVDGALPLLVDFKVEPQRAWLVQRLVPGETLQTRLARGPLSAENTLVVAASILRTLAKAHEAGVLHRDVKPGNIIVRGEDPVVDATLIDFGLARSTWLDPSIRDEAVGTARYTSPEQAGLVETPVDERSDLYSVGVVLFECLAGGPPFDGDEIGVVLRQHLRQAAPDLRTNGVAVPRALSDLVQRLLHKDPAERFQSASSVLADVESILAAILAGTAEPRVVIGRDDRRTRLTEPVFVGRRPELATLMEVLACTRDGNGGLVLVEGESGGGKTRLLDELARQAAAAGALVLRGQGVDQTAQRPFQLLDGVSAGLAALARSDPAEVDGIRERLGMQAEAVVAVLPRLGAVFGAAHEALPEEYGETRGLNALVELLGALGRPEHPVVMLLDDCQWADTIAVRMLAQWCREQPEGGRWLMVVAAFRSEEVASESPLRATSPLARLVLGAFRDADVRDLARSMAGPLPDEALAVLTSLAGGSPFMAEAVLRGMVECGALVDSPGGWQLERGALAEVQTSRRAALFLVRRIELLSQHARLLLEAAAVLGKEFELDLAMSLSTLGAHDVVPALDEARHRRILWVDEQLGRGRFLHDKLRDAVLERMDAGRRAALHLQTARRIEADDSSRVFDLAYHFDAAGESVAALPHALAAAEEARIRHALDASEEHYRIAAKGVASADFATGARVAEGLADVLMLRGSYAEAAVQFERALAMADDRLQRAALTGKLGEIAFRRGDQREACRQLEAGLRQLGRWVPSHTLTFWLAVVWEVMVQAAHCVMPRALVARRDKPSERVTRALRLYSRLAYAYWFRSGRAPCAWAHLRGLNGAERYPPSPELAQAYSEHAPAATMLPWFSRGLAYVRRSLQIRARLGDVWGQGQSLHFYGVVLYSASRYRESIEKCREAIQILSRTGDQWEVNTATWHLGFALYRLGEFAEAAQVCERLYHHALDMGDRSSAGIALSGWSRATNGRVPPEALAAELARQDEDVHTATEVRLAEAVHLLADGRAGEAVTLLEQAWAEVREAGLRQEYVAPILPWLATALRTEIGWLPPADPRRRSLIRKARKVARRACRLARWYRNNLPHALRERALIELARGRLHRARRLLGRGLEVAKAQEAAGEEARIVVVQARLGSALGWSAPHGEFTPDEGVLAEMDDWEPGAGRDGDEPTLSLADRFSGLMESGRAIASATSPEAVNEAVRDAALTLLRAERCQVVDVETALHADLTTTSGRRVDDFSRSVVEQAVRTGVIQRSSPEPSDQVAESLVMSGIRSVLCAPISCEGRVVSCLYVAHRSLAGLFGPDEEQVAAFIATLAGAALEHVAGSEAHFRGLVQNSYDITVVTDAEGHMTYVSPSVYRILGYTPEEMIGQGLNLLQREDYSVVSQALTDTIGDPAGHRVVQARARHRDGSQRWLELSMTNLLGDPAVQGIVTNVHDVTERKNAEDAFAEATEQFRVAFENAPIGMALTGVKPPNQGRFLRVNQALADMLGYERHQLVGRSVHELTHPDDVAADRLAIRRFETHEATTYETEKRYRNASGDFIWVHLKAALMKSEDGPRDYVVSQVVDITERRDAEERLTHQALHDPLTGLPNRRLFLDRLTMALARSERHRQSVAVFYLDVDRFKVINDSLGHEVGDQVLVETAARLQQLVRDSDTLARLGGDEFVLLVEDLEEHEEVSAIAQRIGEALALPLILPELTVSVSTSIGIAIAGRGADAVGLLRDADTAMYRAKEQGRARFAVFDEHLRSRAVGRLQVERDLRAAMEEDRLILHYQPVVDLATGRVRGVEALVRYLDASGRVVYPDQFVDVAEETGLIARLGDWVLLDACRQLAHWRRAGAVDLRLAVNVSPRQLSDGGFAQTMLSVLEETGLPADALDLEITEVALVETRDASLPTLYRLRTMGCSVGIDDFGTGYSSLVYLRRLPVDFIKVDKTFVSGIDAGPEALAIVQAIVRLSQALGLTTIAEGVETEKQERLLRDIGCDLAQGYRMGRPESAARLTEVLGLGDIAAPDDETLLPQS
jgi:diguanylate cyclase (GGDEF)-like protein/PAS domain S-box-containing protein